MRHFGLLGHTSEGAALCFRAFCQEGFATLGPHEHPDVTLDCIALARTIAALEVGDLHSVRATLAVSVERLARAGADFLACPSNTAHEALEQPGPDLALPGLHIADVVAESASRNGYQRIGVLGTRYTMDGPLYPRALAAHGLAAVVPDPVDRSAVNAIVFDDSCKACSRTSHAGPVSASSRTSPIRGATPSRSCAQSCRCW